MFPTMKWLLISALLTLPFQVSSHGNGAPSSRCDSMEPGHWVSPQEGISPYQIIIDKTVITPGEHLNITLRTTRGQTGFKGFFIMVKDGDTDEDGTDGQINESFGEFDLTLIDIKQAQPVHCFGHNNSAMTHVTNDVKDTVELSWIAPKLLTESNIKRQSNPYLEKELKVVATFVKDFWTVWTNVEPVGGVRLMLTDTFHHISPKFKEPQNMDKFRENHRENHGPLPKPPTEVAPATAISPAIPRENIPLEDGYSHFKRAWQYMVNFFGSSSPSSSPAPPATSFS